MGNCLVLADVAVAVAVVSLEAFGDWKLEQEAAESGNVEAAVSSKGFLHQEPEQEAGALGKVEENYEEEPHESLETLLQMVGEFLAEAIEKVEDWELEMDMSAARAIASGELLVIAVDVLLVAPDTVGVAHGLFPAQ